METLIKEVYLAVHAVLIDRIQSGLLRSKKYLTDLMVANDHDKDQCLTYGEFEDMLISMTVSFKPHITENILIKELMDTKGRKKISFDVMKHLIGDNSVTSGGNEMDYLPSQEEAKDGQAGSDSVNPAQLKTCRTAARKVLITFGG